MKLVCFRWKGTRQRASGHLLHSDIKQEGEIFCAQLFQPLKDFLQHQMKKAVTAVM